MMQIQLRNTALDYALFSISWVICIVLIVLSVMNIHRKYVRIKTPIQIVELSFIRWSLLFCCILQLLNQVGYFINNGMFIS